MEDHREKAEGDLCDLLEPSVDSTSAKKSKKKSKKQPLQPAIPLESGQSGQARASTKRPNPQVKAYCYEMRGHVEQAVDKYLELSGKTRHNLPKSPRPA